MKTWTVCYDRTIGKIWDTFTMVLLEDPAYCCTEMEYAMDEYTDNTIAFDKKDLYSKKPSVGILAYDEYDDYAKHVPIDYCPFCGAKIELKLNDTFKEKTRCTEKVVKTCEHYTVKVDENGGDVEE